MKRMRLWVSLLIIWLFFFYNIERIDYTVDLTGLAYLFVPVMAVLTVSVPALRKLPLWALIVSPGILFLVLKVILRPDVWSRYFLLTLTEFFIIAMTTALAYVVSKNMEEFERAIARIAIGPIDTLLGSTSNGQSEMYKELKRARNHGRPLALLAIEVENASIRAALDRMVQEALQAMMKQYVLSDIAKVLCDRLEDYDLIARKDDHFLILLPEVSAEQLFDLSGRLREVVYEQTGVALKVGAASFPEDAVTFDNLVEKAFMNLSNVEGLSEDLEQFQAAEPQPVTTEHRSC